MKKTISLLLVLVMCVSLGGNVFAAESENDITITATRVVPENGLKFYPVEDYNGTIVNDLDSLCVDTTESEVSPQVANPSSANVFQIDHVFVSPIVYKDGKYQFLNNGWKFTPDARTTIMNIKMTEAMQKEVVDELEAETGRKTVGWYIMGKIYMDCYIPKWVEYKSYIDGVTGTDTKAKAVYTAPGTADVALLYGYPEDMTKTYTYGLVGQGVMTVYIPSTNSTNTLYPQYSIKVHFERS